LAEDLFELGEGERVKIDRAAEPEHRDGEIPNGLTQTARRDVEIGRDLLQRTIGRIHRNLPHSLSADRPIGWRALKRLAGCV
jgi:hypothetical protein